jgi:hypothetical protein
VDPIINKIYKVLTKEAPTVDDLMGCYFENGVSILKSSLSGITQDPRELIRSNPEIGFVERVAYFKRFQDVRDPEPGPNKFEEILGRR